MSDSSLIVAQTESPNFPDEKKASWRYPWELKLEVALAAIRGEARQSEISHKYGVSQPMVSLWKRSAMRCLEEHFRRGPTTRTLVTTPNRSTSKDAPALESLPGVLRQLANALEEPGARKDES
ncbi:MAG: hypothetical protein ACPG4K_11175 [Haloferula sp.]